MKKTLFIFSLLASSAAFSQVNFGAQIGSNFGSAKETFSGGGVSLTTKYKSKFGILIGAYAEMPLANSITFRPELNYIQKGGKYSESETDNGLTTNSTNDVTMNFIELPLNVIYSMPAGSGSVFFGGGPSLGFGMSGTYKYNETESGPGAGTPISSSTSIKFDGKKNDLTDNYLHVKSLDLGFGLMAGYKLSNGLSFNLSYTAGLSNLSPDENTTWKNSGIALKVGYSFGGGSSKK